MPEDVEIKFRASRALEAAIMLILVFMTGIAPLKFGLPFVTGLQGFLPQGIREWLVFPWPNEIFTLAAAYLTLLSCIYIVLKKNIHIDAYNNMLMPAFIMCAAVFISAFAAYNPYRAINVSLQVFSYTAFMFALFSFPDKEKLALYVTGVLTAAAMAIGAYAVYQYYIGLEETRQYVYQNMDMKTMPQGLVNRLKGNRVFSTFVYANSLGGFFTITLPLAAGTFFMKAENKWKVWRVSFAVCAVMAVAAVSIYYIDSVDKISVILFCVFSVYIFFRFIFPVVKPEYAAGRAVLLLAAVSAFVFSAWGMYLSRSQGAIFSLAAGVFIAAFFALGKRKTVLVCAAAAVAVFAGVLAVFDINAAELLRSVIKLPSLKVRLEYWSAAYKMLADSPFFGLGPGNFGEMYARYKLAAAEETQMAHNNYLQMWVECGPAAFIAFCTMWGMAASASISALKDKTSGFLPYFTAVSIFAFMIHNFVDFDFYITGLFIPFCGVSALVFHLRRNAAVKSTWRLEKVLVVFFAGLFILGGTAASVMLLRSKYMAESADKLVLSGKRELGELGLRKAIDYLPVRADLWFKYGQISQSKKDWASSEAAYLNAIRLSPGSSFYYYALSRLYDAWKEYDSRSRPRLVVLYAKKALFYYPSSVFYAVELARAYARYNFVHNAAQMYRQVLRMEPLNKEALEFLKRNKEALEIS